MQGISNLYIPSCGLLIAILCSVIFFSKKRIKNKETEFFSRILIYNLIDNFLLVLIIALSITNPDKLGLIKFLNKADYSMYILYASNLFLYVYKIMSKKDEDTKMKNYNFLFYLTTVLDLVFIFVLLLLNVDVHINGEIMYSDGSALNVTLIACALYTTAIFACLLINVKNITTKKMVPLYVLLFFIICVFLLNQVDKTIVIVSAAAAYIDLMLYFTIENPDIKVVNELIRNKELVDEQIENKSNFLFEMSQGIKMPSKNILDLVNKYENSDDKKYIINEIRENAKELIFKTNNILDVSSMEVSKIKIVKEKYDIRKVVKNIEYIFKQQLEENENRLNIEISSSVPKVLYGDEIIIKQVIASILSNAIKNTKNGNINLNIDAITKYDVARIIIRVEDSGKGMSIDKINEILASEKNLTEEDVEKLDISLPILVKTIKILDGNINIRSEENKGTNIQIVIEQLYKKEIDEELEKYKNIVYNKKRVLLLDQKKDELIHIKNIIIQNGLDVTATMINKDIIDKVNNKEKYDLIILDDELGNDNAINILKELKYKIPTVIMLEKEKETIKEKYKEEGFKDYILKQELKDEIVRIISDI